MFVYYAAIIMIWIMSTKVAGHQSLEPLEFNLPNTIAWVLTSGLVLLASYWFAGNKIIGLQFSWPKLLVSLFVVVPIIYLIFIGIERKSREKISDFFKVSNGWNWVAFSGSVIFAVGLSLLKVN